MQIDLNDAENITKALQSLRDQGITQCRLVPVVAVPEIVGGDERFSLGKFPPPQSVKRLYFNHADDHVAGVWIEPADKTAVDCLCLVVSRDKKMIGIAKQMLEDRYGEGCLDRITWQQWLTVAY